MEDVALKSLWANYDKKLKKVVSVNQQMMEEIMKQQAKNNISHAKPFKRWGIILGIPWIMVLTVIVFIGFHSGNPFFTLSFLAILLCNLIALATSIQHLVLINQVNVSNSILEAQEKIAEIKLSTLKSTRLVFLQLPFWTTWYLKPNYDITYWIINALVLFLFTFLSIWLYRNIRLEQLDNKWIKWLFSDTAWNSVIAASDILHQIEDLKES